MKTKKQRIKEKAHFVMREAENYWRTIFDSVIKADMDALRSVLKNAQETIFCNLQCFHWLGEKTQYSRLRLLYILLLCAQNPDQPLHVKSSYVQKRDCHSQIADSIMRNFLSTCPHAFTFICYSQSRAKWEAIDNNRPRCYIALTLDRPGTQGWHSVIRITNPTLLDAGPHN